MIVVHRRTAEIVIRRLAYETRISFRGRTLAGYANWSLDGRNRIRLNANVVWRDAVAGLEAYLRTSPDEAARPLLPKHFVRAAQSVFAVWLAGVAGHEVIHLLLHREPDVRRHAGRYREGAVHEWALGRIDSFLA